MFGRRRQTSAAPEVAEVTELRRQLAEAQRIAGQNRQDTDRWMQEAHNWRFRALVAEEQLHTDLRDVVAATVDEQLGELRPLLEQHAELRRGGSTKDLRVFASHGHVGITPTEGAMCCGGGGGGASWSGTVERPNDYPDNP